MIFRIRQLCVGTILMFLIIIGIMPIALASDDGLSWQTTDVHFRGDRLIVEGYFQNNNRYEIIDNINWFNIRVNLKRHGQWREYVSEKYEDIRVHIRPGQIVAHRFVIYNVEPHHIEEWNVRTHGNYHYHNHHYNERHEHNQD